MLLPRCKATRNPSEIEQNFPICPEYKKVWGSQKIRGDAPERSCCCAYTKALRVPELDISCPFVFVAKSLIPSYSLGKMLCYSADYFISPVIIQWWNDKVRLGDTVLYSPTTPPLILYSTYRYACTGPLNFLPPPLPPGAALGPCGFRSPVWGRLVVLAGRLHSVTTPRALRPILAGDHCDAGAHHDQCHTPGRVGRSGSL